jgi:hypothetical protein
VPKKQTRASASVTYKSLFYQIAERFSSDHPEQPFHFCPVCSDFEPCEEECLKGWSCSRFLKLLTSSAEVGLWPSIRAVFAQCCAQHRVLYRGAFCISRPIPISALYLGW